MSKHDEDDTPTVPIGAELPSARVLHELTLLAKQSPGKKRTAAAWRLVASVAGNPDAHAVLDYAREAELVLPCEQTDSAATNLTWTNPLDGSEMVWIPPGPFIYGTGDKTAEAAGFSLGRWPITNEQFAEFLVETKYTPPTEHPDNEYYLSGWTNLDWDPTVPRGKEHHPVTHVSLFDALAYCKWAGGTLPTEWLWEKAARGSDGRSYPWGDARPESKLAHIARSATCEVGKYSGTRSPYGCEELIGNVSEWCLPEDGTAPGAFPARPHPEVPFPTLEKPSQTCVRGACFMRASSAASKASHRRMLSVARRNQWVGFRLAVLLPVRPA